MTLVPPTIPGADRRLTEFLRKISEEVNRLNALERVVMPAPVAPAPTPETPVNPPANPSVPPPNPATPEAAVRSSVAQMITKNVQGRMGRLSQPQIPYAPRVTRLPMKGDIQSQDGSLVILNDALWQFTGGVDTGEWAEVGGSAPPPVNGERVYIQNRTTAIYFGAAGVDGLLQANSPILPADFNAIGKILRYTTEGVYNTTPTETPTLEFKLKFDAATLPVALISFNPVQTVANTVNMFWYIDVHIVVFGASTLEVFGKLTIGLTNTTTVMTVIGSIVTQSGVNLGINHSLDLTVNMSTQAGGGGPFNNIQQRFTSIELLN